MPSNRRHGRNGQVYLGLTNGAVAVPVPFQAAWSINKASDRDEVTAFGDANKTLYQPYKVPTFDSISQKDPDGAWVGDYYGVLSFEINKKTEGIYAVIDLQATPEAVAELDRQLRLNESVLRTKVIRPDVR